MSEEDNKTKQTNSEETAREEATATDQTPDSDSDGSEGMPFDGFEDDFLQEMMSGNFIEYASYSIKERAIPHIDDGLKPVQRRILHSLYEKDDGRYHKVANIIGHTMQYHPHGDASIGDALVVLTNKQYFIDPQGNFGNIFTGDEASAARYIECRLTPLAREVLFNPEITEFVDSYDGRNREPLTLPAKVPSLLMLGAEGIAVGMRTRILPHNFAELLKAQVKLLQGKTVRVYPDFPTSGTIDVNEYEDGYGKVKVRARIETKNDKTLVIREIPYTTTTESLIASIEEAARKSKIKIASIHDYTAEKVEVEINLPRGIHAEETRQQLFAYTDCEMNLSSQIILIKDNRPVQMAVTDILQHVTDRLVHYLRRELEIELGKLRDRFHEKSLVRIFIENRVYKRIEECETYEAVKAEVLAGLEPFLDQLQREVSGQDIEKLLQIQIRRISRFDLNKNREELENILAAIEQVSLSLENLTEHTIKYLREILRKYGKNFRRRTKITDLQEVDAREVALRNIKVGHDRQNQFIGAAVRNSNKSEEPLLCSEFDRLVLLKGDGAFKVVPVSEKLYVGPVKYLFVADRSQVYSMVYRHRKSKRHYVKRFKIDRYIMDREYRTMPKGCIVETVCTNYGVVLRGEFKNRKKGSDDFIDVDFNQVELRSTTARGFKVCDREIESFSQIKRGSPAPNTEDSAAEKDDDTDTAAAVKTEETPARKAESPSPARETSQDQKTAAAKTAPPPPSPAEPKTTSAEPGKRRKNTPKRGGEQPPEKKRPAATTREKPEKSTQKSAAKTPEKKGGSPKNEKPKPKPSQPPPAATGKPASGTNEKPKQPASPEQPPKKAANQETNGAKKKPGRILIDEDTPFFLE